VELPADEGTRLLDQKRVNPDLTCRDVLIVLEVEVTEI
jgi:hypothetical protein